MSHSLLPVWLKLLLHLLLLQLSLILLQYSLLLLYHLHLPHFRPLTLHPLPLHLLHHLHLPLHCHPLTLHLLSLPLPFHLHPLLTLKLYLLQPPPPRILNRHSKQPVIHTISIPNLSRNMPIKRIQLVHQTRVHTSKRRVIRL
jgi:hypothetical protein